MATTATFNSSYSGDDIQGYILKALLGGETWSTAGVSIQDRVKYKKAIKRLASSGVVTAANCAFTPVGTITIDERSLEPKDIQVNEEVCVYDYKNLWGDTMEESIAETNDAIVNEFVNQVALEVEEATWQGNATGATGTIKDLINGFEYILANEGGVSVTATTLTKANIIAELDKVVDAIPSAVMKKGKENLVIFLSHKASTFLEQALAAQGVNRNNSQDIFSIYGIEVKAVGGLSSDNIMVAGEKANFYFATDVMSDMNDVKILDMRELDGSDNLRFKLAASFDVNIGWVDEVVYYA